MKFLPDDVCHKVCMDTGCSVTLINRKWLQANKPELPIRTMAKPLPIRGIRTGKVHSQEYVVLTMYFPGIDSKNGKDVLAKISREAHLTDDLAAKLLIGTDILVPKKVDIMISKKTGHIGSCGIDIKLEATPKKGIAKSPVCVIAGITIPPFASIAILIHHTATAEDRDLLFEPDDTPVTLFVQLANKDMKSVLARNDTNKLVLLPRNFRLGNLMDIDYDNGFPVLNADVIKLAIRMPKISPSQIPTDHSDEARPLESKHYTGATIYKDPSTAQAFADLLDKFPNTLFKDKGFVYLPKDKWIKIDLRLN